MKITKLTQDLIGKEISCTINGVEINEARIQYDIIRFYICQNQKEGLECSDRLGFQFSWGISDGNNPIMNEVSNIVLRNPKQEYEIY